MKKIICMLAFCILFSITAFAGERQVESKGLIFKIPDTYHVVELGNGNIKIIHSNGNTNMHIFSYDSEKYWQDGDLRKWDDNTIQRYFDEIGSNYQMQDVIECEGAKFIKARYVPHDPYSSSAAGTIAYFTHFSNRDISIEVRDIRPGIQAEEFDDIIKTVRFSDWLQRSYEKKQEVRDAELMEIEKQTMKYNLIAIVTIIPILIISFVLIKRHAGKKRRNKVRDAALSAKATCTCRACGAAMAEDAEICSNCGTRQ